MTKPFSLNDRWPFKKHKGELVSTVIREDPQYIEWCLLDIEGFELDEAAEDEYEREIDDYYYG